MKTKNLHSLKIDGEAEGRVTAVFATLNVVDAHGDVTRPGAFSNEDVRISAYGHESWYGQLPVGRGSIEEVGDEAIFEGQFFLNTTAGRDTFEVVKQMKELQEWSYGFDIVEASHGQEDGRPVQYLDRLKVHEVSPVLLGAGVNTRTLAVKSQAGLKFAEHIEAVVTEVDALLSRTADVVTMRTEQGKSLGADSAEWLTKLDAQMKRLHDLLKVKQTHDDNTGDVEREYARFMRHRLTL